MNQYMKLLFSFAAVCLLSVFSGTTAKASDLPPLEDDPMAYYYSDEYIDRSNAYAAEEYSETRSDAKNTTIQRYNAPSAVVVTPESYGITHDDRFDAAKIRNGIDVSYYQGDIDWSAVKKSGVEFVIIRVGYRGLTTGTLNMDTKFNEYMQGALAADLKVGVYFFSQAITPAEAVEEANYVLQRIAGYNLSLPVAIDYEYGGSDGGRIYNAHLSKEAATSVCAAFCNRIASAGYTPMVYANKNMLETNLNGASLGNAYKIWLAHYTDKTNYANKYSFWQYTSSGSVNGISGRVDMDVWYDTSQMLLVGSENAKKYITQLFYALLDREPDSLGLATYTSALTQGDMTASRLVSVLTSSAEYKEKNYSDEEFIRRIYRAMLGREASEAEVNSMLTRLENGVSHRYILSMTSKSQEFSNFCASLGMERGFISVTENRDRNYNYTSFVMRCYEKILGRKADASGLNTWTGNIFNGGGGVSVIRSLVNSKEFIAKNYSNDEFMKRLYQAMLGRDSSSSERAGWVSKLEQGVSYLYIIKACSGSAEFKNLCSQYGMSPGSITLTEARDQNLQYTAFVMRCYEKLLDRKADVSGLNSWTKSIMSGGGGVSVIRSLVNSKEFIAKNYSNDEFMKRLYKAMLGRDSGSSERAGWVSKLEQGVSYLYIIKSCSGSPEFKNLCSQYGMSPGSITLTEARDRNIQITGFVSRCYQTALQRSPDIGGLNNWCSQLLAKKSAPEDVAYCFVFSQEAKKKYSSNDAFVEMLYRLCLGRGSDPAGKTFWLNKLKSGSSRYSVFLGCTHSSEFKAIIKSYGF